MYIIIDIIFLALIFLFGFLGYKKGFVNVLISFLSIFIIIIMLWLLVNPITDIICKNTNIDENIQQNIINKYIGTNQNEINVKDILLTKEMKESASYSIVKAGVGIILYFVLNIILFIFNKVISKTVDLIPGINTVNKLAGSMISILKLLLITCLALYAIMLLKPVMNSKIVEENINHTMIIKLIYENNPVANFLSGKNDAKILKEAEKYLR